jgi:hypothetical protein
MAAKEILPKRRAVAQMSQVVHGQRPIAQTYGGQQRYPRAAYANFYRTSRSVRSLTASEGEQRGRPLRAPNIGLGIGYSRGSRWSHSASRVHWSRVPSLLADATAFSDADCANMEQRPVCFCLVGKNATK